MKIVWNGADGVFVADDGTRLGELTRTVCEDPQCRCAWGHEVLHWGQWPSVAEERAMETAGLVEHTPCDM